MEDIREYIYRYERRVGIIFMHISEYSVCKIKR